MKILNEEMRNSIRLEFLLSEKENMDHLYESRGSMSDIEKYVDVFEKKLRHKTLYGFKSSSFIIKGNPFSKIKDCFFNEVYWEIQYNKKNKNTIKGGYNPKFSVIGDNGKLNTLKGKFILGGNWENIEKNLPSIVAHELLHAYENWNRLKNGAEGLHDLSTRLGYYKANQMNATAKVENDWTVEDITNIIYKCIGFEVNAFVAQLNQSIKNNRMHPMDSETGMGILNEIPDYKNFIIMGENLKELDKQKEYLQPDIEWCWEKIKGEKRNYKQIMNYLLKMYDKAWKKVRFKVSRFMRSLYEEGPAIEPTMHGYCQIIEKRNIVDYLK